MSAQSTSDTHATTGNGGAHIPADTHTLSSAAAVQSAPDIHTPPGSDGVQSADDTQLGIGAAATGYLRFAVETLNDVEALRIATENRLRSWDQNGLPSMGHERARADAILGHLVAAETQATAEVERAMKTHPLGPWVQRTIGVGLKQGGRMIAAIGDPYWNDRDDRPRRGPAELWAYCGYHTVPFGGHLRSDNQGSTAPGRNVAAKRRRGERANWNADAKMRTFLVAEKAIMFRHSPYRPVYDAARAKHAEAVHSEPCPRCGPAGHPAQPGSPLSDGHKHARALREVAKAILRDLWREALATSRTTTIEPSSALAPQEPRGDHGTLGREVRASVAATPKDGPSDLALYRNDDTQSPVEREGRAVAVATPIPDPPALTPHARSEHPDG